MTATIDAATGDVVERYVYTAYGEATVYYATWTNPAAPTTDGPLYCGYFFDAETGDYRARHRELITCLSTFDVRDPIAADKNLYRYVVNDPISLTDATGMAVPGLPPCLQLQGGCGGSNGWPSGGSPYGPVVLSPPPPPLPLKPPLFPADGKEYVTIPAGPYCSKTIGYYNLSEYPPYNYHTISPPIVNCYNPPVKPPPEIGAPGRKPAYGTCEWAKQTLTWNHYCQCKDPNNPNCPSDADVTLAYHIDAKMGCGGIFFDNLLRPRRDGCNLDKCLGVVGGVTKKPKDICPVDCNRSR